MPTNGGAAKSGLLPFRPTQSRVGRAPAWARERGRALSPVSAEEQELWADASGVEALDKGKRFPVKKFRKAAKRVQAANAKLVAFEHGFIHEDGIKDREWYRNLDVAPGKWLGKSIHKY